MSKLRFVGLDVHAETIAVAVAEPGGEVRSLGTIPNKLESVRKMIGKLGTDGRLKCCYEAGPTGYVLYLQIAQLGVACEVIAPSLVPVTRGAFMGRGGTAHPVRCCWNKVCLLVIDLAYTIAPAVEYRLNQNAFGGFDLQGRKDGESYYSTAAGKLTLRDPQYAYPELDWPSEPWYDFTITLTGNGKTVGAAVIDHPRNPPTLWHNSRSLWMLNPSITAIGPVTILPESPLTLRYRVVVHDGPPPVDVLQKLTAEWRGL